MRRYNLGQVQFEFLTNKRSSPRGGAFATLHVLLLSACLAGCQGGPVPKAEFVAQAEQLHALALQSTVTTDRDLNDYFDEMGRRIIAGATAADASKTKDPTFANMKFHLVGCGTINAYTTGGGHVYIYNALLQHCETEEELAAVMAHEFAHAVGLDIQGTGMRPTLGAGPDRIAWLYVVNRFSAQQEQQADALAFQFYTRGGWDPDLFQSIFQRLRSYDAAGVAPDRQPLGSRATIIAAMVQKLPAAAKNWRRATVADPQSFKELRSRAATFGERLTLGDRGWLYLRAFPNCILPADDPAQRAAQAQLRRDITPLVPEIPKEAS